MGYFGCALAYNEVDGLVGTMNRLGIDRAMPSTWGGIRMGTPEHNDVVIAAHDKYPDRILPSQRRAIQAGLRSLGRLRDPEALPWLMSWAWETDWARYAAEALGDFGDPKAIPALISAYPQYGETLRGDMPPRLPSDDRPGFEWLDRMYETPYEIASALARLPLDDPRDVAALRRISPLDHVSQPFPGRRKSSCSSDDLIFQDGITRFNA